MNHAKRFMLLLSAGRWTPAHGHSEYVSRVPNGMIASGVRALGHVDLAVGQPVEIALVTVHAGGAPGDQHLGPGVAEGLGATQPDTAGAAGHQHSGAAAQPPVDLTGEHLAGLLQGAAGVEQTVDAFAHFAVEVGDAAVTDVGRGADFARFLLIAHVDAGPGHRFHHTVGLQLAVDLADGVAMQSGLHRQLARARQPVAGWVMPGRNGEADLVVQLGRCRNVAFLLDVESHAGGPGWNAATLRSECSGDNWFGVL